MHKFKLSINKNKKKIYHLRVRYLLKQKMLRKAHRNLIGIQGQLRLIPQSSLYSILQNQKRVD